jgi:hypothetical protein
MATAMRRLPRRWDAEIDGIRWLPRMIDKARMRSSGTLGAYLIGNSPVDRALLKRLAIATDDFVRIASEEVDDAGVLAALRRRGFDEARVRRWSQRFERTYRLYIRLWDIDEGYAPPNAIERPILALFQAVERPLMALFRLVSPAP